VSDFPQLKRIDKVTVYAIAIAEMTGKQIPLPAPQPT
jgi:hypothetical protein